GHLTVHTWDKKCPRSENCQKSHASLTQFDYIYIYIYIYVYVCVIKRSYLFLFFSEGFISNMSVHRQYFPDDEDEKGAAIRKYNSHIKSHETLICDPGSGPYILHGIQEKYLMRFCCCCCCISQPVNCMSCAVRALADPSHQRAGTNLRYFEQLLSKELRARGQSQQEPADERPIQLDTYERPKDYLPEREVYEALCRGEGVKMTQKRRSRLFCRYQDGNRSPRLLLKPMKEEDEWDSPHIVRYLEALSDEEIEKIKELAKPNLARATVRDPKTGVLTVAHYRVSKSAWLEGEDDPVIARVNQRIEDITGLSVDTAELLQVANYGVGGQYEPHYDFSRKDEPDAFVSLGTGNRVATFLNYMSDVEAGGATVFPDFGAAIWPRKGTAVFWYNLFKSGEGDYRTRHAACPVLVGSKWVSNKWIHERGQEFRRPCGLTEVD
uniref:Prolyl 4-hydroxylase subunit alpha-2-like n=1 Tax=Sinocyclocheilus grahami TaxID=75366 RepID=A0A672RBM6_SINGR